MDRFSGLTGPELAAAIHRIEARGALHTKLLLLILRKEMRIMALSDEIIQQVAETKGVEQSAIVLIQALHDKVTNALDAGDLDAARAALADAKSSSDALAAAVAANPA